jgi:glycosyltransferase involved in cell wall biosynthesis
MKLSLATDGTRAVVLDLHRRYPDRIVPILQERNPGALRNLESILTVCRGQYLAILEGDDYWTSVVLLASMPAPHFDTTVPMI